MRYAIISNPASGRLSVDQKRAALTPAARILDAKIYGLDTFTRTDLARCATALAHRCDVLVVAGGDGTFSDIVNAVDTRQLPVAFLPMGTGNALRSALHYRGNVAQIARRIRGGAIRDYDLILCDETRLAFMASVGIEGTILHIREGYVSRGKTGLRGYVPAILKSYFKAYRRTTAAITIDDETRMVKNLLTLMVVKQPYYGMGMNVVPKARFEDRHLHICCINSGFFKTLFGGITAFIGGSKIGRYRKGRRVTVNLGMPLPLQFDGNQGWKADRFAFQVLPGALKIKC